ncbi:hypothetical protein NHX12_008113 [Muraenolepis orangiensis]|uniref:von Willebrand factor A domain-containing protein 5A n=1 Tax=Muraenolepis orangiensis TaxID=630683 RepID=A0A9Q0DKN0_9TELE|nr:hypothetical protein NHX12_008113 [Muraenolepis orangiensis]
MLSQSWGDAEGCVTVKYSLAGQPTQNQLRFSLQPTEDTGLTAHRLGARALICSLEAESKEQGDQSDGVKAKEKAIEVSIQSGVSSSLTAFIAVNKGSGEARASGSWLLESPLATALGKTLQEVESSKPESVSPEVWATVLAVTWLHGFKMDAQVEWEFLAMKAVSWLHGEKVPCLTECLRAGNLLLGCQVQESSMGM